MLLLGLLSPNVTAVLLIIFTILYYWWKDRGTPPGPTGLPYLGIYPFITDPFTMYLQLTEYAKTYGDIYSFTFTGRRFINLGSLKAIREFHIANSEAFSGRAEAFSILSYTLGHGVTMINGEAWKLLRKFYQNNFKNYGLIGGSRDASIKNILADLKAKSNESFDMVEFLTDKCMDTMRVSVFGEKGISDEDVKTFSNWHAAALDNLSGPNLLMVGPFARLLYCLIPGNRRALNLHLSIRKLLLSIVQKISASFDGDHATCLVENFYKEKEEKRKQNDPSWKYYKDLALVCSLNQFLGDGTYGVATFVGQFFNELILHPEEQDKIYNELMDVVGPNRQPCLEDKKNLPYTSAFINECCRTSEFFPLFPSLECTKEITIRGYRIPKGTVTLLNFWCAHRDPEVYKDPYKFSPSRFLPDSSGKKEEMPLQFGVGKRHCNGEGYVMLQAFIFLTTIVKNFRILPSSDPQKMSETFLEYTILDVIVEPRDN